MKTHSKSVWSKLKTPIVIIGSLAAMAATVQGMRTAIHSSMFLIRVVEVADQPEQAPVDSQTLTELAAVPAGSVGLFDLDLSVVEKRILAHEWIRDVHLQKRFPQTLVISVEYRDPHALIETENGSIAYVDTDGKIFGKIDLNSPPDLPILNGPSLKTRERIVEALKIVDSWNRASPDTLVQIASLSYDFERGYRAMITYPLFQKDSESGRATAKGRVAVDFGNEIHQDFDAQLGRLSHVFKYLADNGIGARQIWADTGKKIVVKIARGS